ncbi:MAG TPA: putative beta-lysine N-acetyltransferase [Epulopiscium sp.]|nr:putative beta-lysine N-acetyltransferase [Candidatus Epulonipiscium sp.]
MYDTIIKKGHSQIQHGPQNDRIYLMDLAKEDMPEILGTLDQMAATYGYTKIFAKVPKGFSKSFVENGYATEAVVPDFFNGTEDCLFMGKYRDKQREKQVDHKLNNEVIERALLKRPIKSLELKVDNYQLPNHFSLRKAKPSDADEMSKLYAKVFDSYPFPVFESKYIRETMDNHVVYFTICKGYEIVALSSCEMYMKDASVEMTDFAVFPAYRGYNFSYLLLREMEKEMKKQGIKTAYTIARSCSYGMNNTFAKCGYDFSGILVKNTQIGGKIEDMNVWYKSLK